MTAMMDMSIAKKSLRGSPLPLMRGARVKRLAAKAKSAILAALRRMNAEAVSRVESGKAPLALDAIDRWSKWWVSGQRGVLGYVALEGAKQARMEFGLSKAETAVAEGSAIYVGQTADDFLMASYQAPVDEWLQAVASASTRAHAAKINSIWQAASAYWDEEKNQGLTPRQIAERIREEMPEFSLARARMIAYTNTNWAFNSGIRTEYKTMGVTVLEWMTSEDDSVCPWCRMMDGARVKIDDPFWRAGDEFGVEIDGKEGGKDVRTMKLPFAVDHPPLHPNCACVLLPVVV
jgi:SPP1 gp7 family putative phage head morphogenesis protein